MMEMLVRELGRLRRVGGQVNCGPPLLYHCQPPRRMLLSSFWWCLDSMHICKRKASFIQGNVNEEEMFYRVKRERRRVRSISLECHGSWTAGTLSRDIAKDSHGVELAVDDIVEELNRRLSGPVPRRVERPRLERRKDGRDTVNVGVAVLELDGVQLGLQLLCRCLGTESVNCLL